MSAVRRISRGGVLVNDEEKVASRYGNVRRWRHEYKYMLDAKQEAILKVKALSVLSRDPHVREDGTYHGVMPNRYFTVNVFGQITGPTNVPEGWIVPLSYIRLGRIANENDELAKVRLIVPHSMGHTESNDRIYACYYEITYERGI